MNPVSLVLNEVTNDVRSAFRVAELNDALNIDLRAVCLSILHIHGCPDTEANLEVVVMQSLQDVIRADLRGAAWIWLSEKWRKDDVDSVCDVIKSYLRHYCNEPYEQYKTEFIHKWLAFLSSRVSRLHVEAITSSANPTIRLHLAQRARHSAAINFAPLFPKVADIEAALLAEEPERRLLGFSWLAAHPRIARSLISQVELALTNENDVLIRRAAERAKDAADSR